MNSLIVIKPTQFNFINNLIDLEKALEDHIVIKEYTQETLMESIIDEIGLTPDLVGDTQNCYETSQNIYQICFVGYDKESLNNQPINTIATCLSGGETVYGPAVLINSKILEPDYLCSQESVFIKDLAIILNSKFIHKGIIIPALETEDITEYEYQNHPLQAFEKSENTYGKYKLVETTFLGFQIGFFYNTESININKRATRILGKQKLYGDIVIFNKLPHEYLDLDLELFNKISKLSYGSLKNREARSDEDKEGQKINGLPVAFNKYCLLNKRYLEHKKCCDHCKDKFINNEKLLCTGCFRVRYHNKECQKKDWINHKVECLYN